MPIDTDSTDWEQADWIDYLFIEIGEFISRNSEKAYRLEELVKHLVENEPQVFPNRLLEESEDAEYARYSLVAGELNRLVWLNHVEVRNVDGELYYTVGEDARFPLAEIEYDIPEQIDEKIEEDRKALEERIQRLEHQFRQEFDRY